MNTSDWIGRKVSKLFLSIFLKQNKPLAGESIALDAIKKESFGDLTVANPNPKPVAPSVTVTAGEQENPHFKCHQ